MLFGVGVPFLGLIAAVALAWGRGVGWVDLLLLLGFYCFTILGVTIGFHRMFTHRALSSGPVVRFVLAVAGSMSGQGSVLEWCAIHREHHKHSDREGDPHSPHLHDGGFVGMLQGMMHSHFGWLFSHNDPPANTVVADLLADPVLRLVDRLFWLWMPLGWLLPAVIAGSDLPYMDRRVGRADLGRPGAAVPAASRHVEHQLSLPHLGSADICHAGSQP